MRVDRARVQAAIEAAERRTSAELVVAVAPFFVGSVRKAARRAFARLGVAATRARNGVLVFVVPARREVVVLPDEAAEARVDERVWRDVAARVAAGFHGGTPTDGLVDAIGYLADALGAPFPPRPGDVDELADAPVVAG